MEMKEYLEKSSKILDELQTTEQGLSEAEAARRLSEHGPNRLAAGKKKSNLQRFFEELKDPMILILLAAALISGITSAYEANRTLMWSLFSPLSSLMRCSVFCRRARQRKRLSSAEDRGSHVEGDARRENGSEKERGARTR